MLNISCVLRDCIFEDSGICTLTHVSSPSKFSRPDCIYFRPKENLIKEYSKDNKN